MMYFHDFDDEPVRSVECNCPCKQKQFEEKEDLQKIMNTCDSKDNMEKSKNLQWERHKVIMTLAYLRSRIQTCIEGIENTVLEKEFLGPLLVLERRFKCGKFDLSNVVLSDEDSDFLHKIETKIIDYKLATEQLDYITGALSKSIDLLSRINARPGSKIGDALKLLRDATAGNFGKMEQAEAPVEDEPRLPTEQEEEFVKKIVAQAKVYSKIDRAHSAAAKNLDPKNGRINLTRADGESLVAKAKEQKEKQLRHYVELKINDEDSEDELFNKYQQSVKARNALRKVSNKILTDGFLNREEAWQKKVRDAMVEEEMAEGSIQVDEVVDEAQRLVQKHVDEEVDAKNLFLESLQTLRVKLMQDINESKSTWQKEESQKLLDEVLKQIREEGQREFKKDLDKINKVVEAPFVVKEPFPSTVIHTSFGDVRFWTDNTGVKIRAPKQVNIDVIKHD